jgi:hypothetical protein
MRTRGSGTGRAGRSPRAMGTGSAAAAAPTSDLVTTLTRMCRLYVTISIRVIPEELSNTC